MKVPLFLFALGIALGLHLSYLNNQEAEQQEHFESQIKEQKIIRQKNKLLSEVKVLQPEDRAHLIDCSDESRTFGSEPLVAYKWMEMFSGKSDPISGFLYSNNQPLFVHAQGISNLKENSPILLGFRGDTAGVHRSLISPPIFKIHRENPDSVMLLPGSYVKLDADTFQSVCHRRNYSTGYIGSNWPAMHKRSWEVYNRLLEGHGRIYMFAYSNGGVVKDEFFETTPYTIKHVELSNAFEYAREYAETHEFKSPHVTLVEGMVDIETNYSKHTELWNLTKYLLEYVDKDPKRIYYAACTIESPVTQTHIYLINALNMVGDELQNGVVRYQNSLRNIYIDIVTKDQHSPYMHKAINLQTQTVFLPNRNVQQRLDLGHYKIVAYAVNEFNKLARLRRSFD